MPEYQPSRVIQYNDIYFSCIHQEKLKERFRLSDHALIYVKSGSLEIESPSGTLTIMPGQCIFVRKDSNLTLAKSMAEDGEPYKAITMVLKRRFLLDYYRRMPKELLPHSCERSQDSILIIPSRPDVSSLFLSLMPYFWSDDKPDGQWLENRRTEGLNCILRTDNDVYASLFDFTSRWKIGLVDFMEDNYTLDLSLEELANYSGRSLSTFNRDFRKVFGTSPQKWIIARRLQSARDMLREGRMQVQEVMADVGFCNLSYFSRIYKDAFGYPPSEERSSATEVTMRRQI